MPLLSDTTPPAVSITSPVPGASLNPSSIAVSASASDPTVYNQTTSGVASVQFRINGQNLGSPDTIVPYSVTWNASSLPDGSYTITAVATDGAGNTTTSNSMTVTLSTPVVIDTDSDDDGVGNSLDLCPNTPTSLVSISPSVINQRGCPLPQIATFSIRPDLASADLRAIPSFELGNSYAKVSYPTSSYSLVRNAGNYYDRLDIDANLTISQGSISLNSAALPELNRPARLTFYGVPASKHKILKDGATCSTCTDASYDPATKTFSFNVTSFSTFTLDFTPEADSIAPTVVNDNTPSSLAVGTVGTIVTVTTSEDASCKYSTVSNTPYSSMTNAFTTTNAVSHAASVPDLSNGSTYTYYIRCEDASGNATTTDLILSFSVANQVTLPPAGGGGGSGGGGGARAATVSTSPMSNPNAQINPLLVVATLTPQSTVTQSFPSVTKWLTIGMSNVEVKILQQILNALNHVVSSSGVGSKGQETDYFGPATLRAVQSFQCKVLSVCAGTPVSTGYGGTGPRTRAALNSQSSALAATSSVVFAPAQVALTTQPTANYRFNRSLKVGDTGTDVKALQIFLNTHGFTISATGPGSLGNETTYYGTLTAKAISMLQERYASEILAPNNLSGGTGFFGPATVKKVNGMLK